MYLEMWSMTRTSTQELIRIKTVWQQLPWGPAPLLLAINMKMLLGWRGGSFPGITSVLVYWVGPDQGQTWMGRVKTHTFYFFAISGFHFFPCYFDSILPSLSVSSLPSPFSIYFGSWYKIFFCKHESGKYWLPEFHLTLWGSLNTFSNPWDYIERPPQCCQSLSSQPHFLPLAYQG